MKFRDKIGDESVQDLIREACERARQLPHEDFRDPWPDRRSFNSEAMPVYLEPKTFSRNRGFMEFKISKNNDFSMALPKRPYLPYTITGLCEYCGETIYVDLEEQCPPASSTGEPVDIGFGHECVGGNHREPFATIVVGVNPVELVV